ncbi:GNAT family N-acetyltransferase [Indiicoccus explosivorum]|uniref:GNAT family N-acetyltransferase n=1 Tax=Indiicoccus explosivorum TaxID=1917864 RepID=UPI000B43E92D|nr:GNAT family N-acetyltransferase [Indiicoccus explosivorum]
MIRRILTDRLILREFKVGDWQAVHAYASDEEVCRYQPWGPNTIAESRGFVRQVLMDRDKEPRTRFAFAVTTRSEKMIGAGELNIRSFSHHTAEIGYVIHPDYWGQGLATEVGELLLGFGFKRMNMHRVYATCDVRNTGSRKVLERIGMTQEGKLRDHLLLRDGWRDSYVYSVLEHEWNGGRKNGH